MRVAMRLLTFVCSLLLISLGSAAPQSLPELEQLLTSQLPGAFPVLLPAKSVETALPDAERVRSAHHLMVRDIGQIVQNFESDGVRTGGQQEFKRFVFHQIDKQLANSGASSQFLGLGPTLILDRQIVVLWIPQDRRQNTDWTHRALSLVSSFERTPQAGEDIHESPSPSQLMSGAPTGVFAS